MVSTDVYRPAAIEQLKTVAAQAGVGLLPLRRPRRSRSTSRSPRSTTRASTTDVLLVDTAGRLAVDEAMMAEIQALHAAVKPIETFVRGRRDARSGCSEHRASQRALPLTGIVLTRWTATRAAARRCRCATSPANRSSSPAWARKLSGLEPSTPTAWPAILGMGDILGARGGCRRNHRHREKATAFAQTQDRQGFDLDDLRDQLEQMAKMGGVSMQALPGIRPGGEQGAGSPPPASTTRCSKRHRGIINSMTRFQALKPESSKASPQAPHRRAGARSDSAGGQSPAQPVRADAEGHETVLQGGMSR